ncbi:hypothetical protein Rsub_11643 [Raphidocelis subcapitata]|uniref:LYR motif-containing protein 2 n=1 Tax=Raphidocelis subcapitata TaxID=307507 RepID=A0A2V0PGH2_9CHLO|nr:hypothetical protein Rsub_11643 [Raphidocelis subcapitata]|eukprot:GBF98649.1 hypothetical protein Rsub_11643 [Raphidocelis subcapitata]
MAAGSSELSLFILRSQVLSLYRSFFRTCRQIPEPNKGEVLAEVRREFRAGGGAAARRDAYAVKYALSEGRAKLKTLSEMIGLRR